jgi:hypothetical protein
MDNPLAPKIGPGYFSEISSKNKSEDLSKIIDLRGKRNLNLKCFEIPKKVLVINLPEREDRWIRFGIKNQELFQKLEVRKVPGIVEKIAFEGIFKAHLSCMRYSQDIGEPIIVMEDDCELASGWPEKIVQVFQELPLDWDVLVGNHYFFSKIEILTDHLAKPKIQASSANFVIYNTSCYQKALSNNHLRSNFNLMDIDHFLTSDHIPINNYSIWPMISREFVSVSDHYKKVRNMEHRIREHAHQFQFIDSDIYYPSIESW